MITGLNTNFRHRGVLFHVQSEASGIKTPHILTHLFKGGDILASMKAAHRFLFRRREKTKPRVVAVRCPN